jgi:L-fuculose-phosphate aldolase
MSVAHLGVKQQMIAAGKILVRQGQDDFTRGHISVRLPDDPSLFLMKPHSVGLDEITLDNILTIDLNGKVVEGTAPRHSEVFIHSEIYKAREDVHCVLHTHPLYSVALSATGRPLRALSQPSALFYEAVGIYRESMCLIRTTEMGAAVARALGQHRIVLLKNHGAVAATATLKETVISMIMFENAAAIQMAVEAVEADPSEMNREDILRLQHEISRPEQFAVNFDYLARRTLPS